MKRPLAAIVVSTMIVAMLCCDESPMPEQARQPDSTSSDRPLSADSTTYDSLMTVLLALESDIMSNRDDPNRAVALLEASFDTISGCFLTVGRGVKNPAHPTGAQKEGQKIAARRRAGYWAMYLKAWRKGTRLPYSHPIAGKIIYSKTLHEEERDDTLFMLMQTPHGSIVLNNPY